MRPTRFEKPEASRNDWQVIRTLLPYLLEFKGRVALALILLVMAKFASVAVPLVLKEIVDALDQPRAMLVLPVLLLLGYGGYAFAVRYLVNYEMPYLPRSLSAPSDGWRSGYSVICMHYL